MKLSKEKIILTVAPILAITVVVCGAYFIHDLRKSSGGKQLNFSTIEKPLIYCENRLHTNILGRNLVIFPVFRQTSPEHFSDF